MNKTLKLLFGLLFVLFSTIGYSQTLTNLLPKNDDIKGWKLTDTIKSYKGDELYTYIDGGAEIFIEYGFKQIALGIYSDKANRQLQVEVYEMADSAAAYGTYTFYLNGEGKPVNAGQEAMMIDYYSVARKGNLIVVVSAPILDDSLKNSIVQFASFVCSNTSGIKGKPDIINKIEKTSLSGGYIKYIKGNVGLSNIYKFIPGNSFVFQQGASFENNGNKIIMFQYSSETEAKKELNNALEKMKQSNQESKFTNIDSGFSYFDYKNNMVCCEVFNNYILVLIGKDTAKIEHSRQKILKF